MKPLQNYDACVFREQQNVAHTSWNRGTKITT